MIRPNAAKHSRAGGATEKKQHWKMREREKYGATQLAHA